MSKVNGTKLGEFTISMARENVGKSSIHPNEFTLETDEHWAKRAKEDAAWLVNHTEYPWDEDQIKRWLQGWLAGTGEITVAAIRIASLDKLKEWHRELSK